MVTQITTLQIATFGTDNQEGIISGLRVFPVHKLVLICYNSDKQNADEFSKRIGSTLGIPITIYSLARDNIIRDTIEKVSEILKNTVNDENGDKKEKYKQVLINISSGNKLLGCAALSAAFINGINAFGMDDETGTLMPVPILKLSYSEVISEIKVKILKSIYNSEGGHIESLEKLAEVSGYGKPMLSYHIHGARNSKGLVDLGLVETEKGARGKTSAKLSTLGRILVASKAINNI